jgi:hypothetical protein
MPHESIEVTKKRSSGEGNDGGCEVSFLTFL